MKTTCFDSIASYHIDFVGMKKNQNQSTRRTLQNFLFCFRFKKAISFAIFNMTSDRTRILPSIYIALDDFDYLHDGIEPTIEHGEDNPTYSNDEISLEHRKTRTTDDSDEFSVAFRTNNTNVDLKYRTQTNQSVAPHETTENQTLDDEEVGTTVSCTDDPTLSVLTFRSWFLGLLFTCLLSFVNQFFSYRTSPLFVGTLVAQLISYPLGRAMANMLPTRKFSIFRWKFTLNPGPFTIKEHCIITAMANATCVRFEIIRKIFIFDRLF